MQDLINLITKQYLEFTDKTISEFFEPYYRSLGIKGKITNGKTKWRGLRMHIENNFDSTTYQLFQRGIPVSGKLEISNTFKYGKSKEDYFIKYN